MTSPNSSNSKRCERKGGVQEARVRRKWLIKMHTKHPETKSEQHVPGFSMHLALCLELTTGLVERDVWTLRVKVGCDTGVESKACKTGKPCNRGLGADAVLSLPVELILTRRRACN